ncbi:MAG UNVERIFIED_CONTAM: hypothetical protein LVR29_26375 [Microcystis novacekii LVE1205-3]|jgi:DNA replicative helicase MCM subunit Mcm2 (Cdc46/Mcm family)
MLMRQQVNSHGAFDKLRAYISIVKDRFNPVVGEDAALLLQRHYENVAPQSVQQFPSLSDSWNP